MNKEDTLRLTLEEYNYKLSDYIFPSNGLEMAITEAMGRYATSQTSALEKEIEELMLTDSLKDIISEINYIKGLIDNKRFTNAELSFGKLTEQVKDYVGI